MPGYQLANCDKAKIDKKYFCSFCDLLLRDAVKTSCGHSYCLSCLGNLRNPVLPLVLVCLVDEQKLQGNEVFADNFTNQEVASMVVSCNFTSEGCPWKGEVMCLEMHVSREHERVYEEIDTCNDHSHEQPSNVPITERDGDERQLQTRISRLEGNEVEVQRRFDDANMESSLIFGELMREIELNRRKLALQDVMLADLEEYRKLQQFTNYDGQLVWKITDFDRKRSEAVNEQMVSFHSQPFHTSRNGYKMCARIFLNGDGMGRGTHISLFFVVMRGEYDAILRWPFRQRVTFMLLDQDNVEHVIHSFRPDPNSSSFQRPRRDTNIASGCPMFCSIEELNNHAYVRDDTIFFKIIVDTSNLP